MLVSSLLLSAFESSPTFSKGGVSEGRGGFIPTRVSSSSKLAVFSFPFSFFTFDNSISPPSLRDISPPGVEELLLPMLSKLAALLFALCSFSFPRNSAMLCGRSLRRGCIAASIAPRTAGEILSGNAGKPSSLTSLASGGVLPITSLYNVAPNE